MKKLMNVIALSALGLATTPVYSDEGPEIRINNIEGHNQNMSQCVKTALDKHPGGVTEVEFERKDEQFIFEVEIQVKEGTKWKVVCDAVTGQIIKDKEVKKEMKDKNKENNKKEVQSDQNL